MSGANYERPCWGGPCTERGMAEPGFCRCKAMADEIEKLRAPITMQDVRLVAGEGKLEARTVLDAVNAILRQRAR